MTRTSNARLAGATLLLYIAVGITDMVAGGRATAGSTPAEKLATLASHEAALRGNLVAGLLTCFFALILAVTFWALTREQDPELAMLGLACRAGEGILGAAALPFSFGLLALAPAEGVAADPTSAAIAGYVLGARSWNPLLSATFFAVGSLLFTTLLWRARSLPRALGGLGVAASALLVVALPLQLGGLLAGTPTLVVWVPMAAFEIALALLWLVRGAGEPRGATPAGRDTE